MTPRCRTTLLAVVFALLNPFFWSQSTVVFTDAGFPVADSTPIAESSLRQGFADAREVASTQLASALGEQKTKLLVLPYGSAYPEAAWPAILRYLDRGGNLVVLGGKPFTRAAYQVDGHWQLREPSVAASLELFIHDYQGTPGSNLLRFEPNPDVQPQLPAFSWKQAFSPVLRLSVTPMFPREIGSTGDEDADLTTLAWGSRDTHRRAAPVFLIDHHRLRFVGGRWTFLACEPTPAAFDNPQLLSRLQEIALRTSDRFTFRPRVPLFLPGELLEFHYEAADTQDSHPEDTLKITVRAEQGMPEWSLTVPANASHDVMLPQSVAGGSGFHTVEATLIRHGSPVWTYRSGFWLRNWAYLRSGPKLDVGRDYFELDG